MRLDLAVSTRFNISRSQAAAHISKGSIYIDGIKIIKPSFLISESQEINIISTDNIITPLSLHIIYEDDHLAIINKKTGEVMHAAHGHHHQTTIAHALELRFPQLSDLNGPQQRGLVHRLDADTSGLVIIAFSNEVHLKLKQSFKEIIRKYLACVLRKLNTTETWSDYISYNRQRAFIFQQANSKLAITHVKPLKYLKNQTFIECTIKTGLQHQIRVQASYHGHPVIGDKIYGRKNNLSNIQMLHAYRLEFKHPVTNKQLIIESFPTWFSQINNQS